MIFNLPSADQFTETMLHYLATGLRSLGSGSLRIELYPSRNSQTLPVAHTCSQTLVLPIYPNQKTFDKKIELALANGGGFQIA